MHWLCSANMVQFRYWGSVPTTVQLGDSVPKNSTYTPYNREKCISSLFFALRVLAYSCVFSNKSRICQKDIHIFRVLWRARVFWRLVGGWYATVRFLRYFVCCVHKNSVNSFSDTMPIGNRSQFINWWVHDRQKWWTDGTWWFWGRGIDWRCRRD